MNSVPAAAVWLKLPQYTLRYIKNSAYIEGAYAVKYGNFKGSFSLKR